MAKLDKYGEWKQDGELEQQLALIRSLSMQGCSVEEIAPCVGLSKRQFFRMQAKYADVRKAVRSGRRPVVAFAQSKLMERVQAGDITAIIYSLKIYGGDFFNDRKFLKRTQVTGAEGGPIATEQKVVLYNPETEPALEAGAEPELSNEEAALPEAEGEQF